MFVIQKILGVKPAAHFHWRYKSNNSYRNKQRDLSHIFL